MELPYGSVMASKIALQGNARKRAFLQGIELCQYPPSVFCRGVDQ